MLPARIQVLLFDLGGTVVFPNFRRMAEELEADGIHVAADHLRRSEVRARFQVDDADLIARSKDDERWAGFLGAIAREAGIEAVPPATLARLRAYPDQHNLWEEVPEGMGEVLARLARHYRLGVISNANGMAARKLEEAGLASYFETIVDSHVEGVEKPDPRIFQVALDRMQATPDQAAYVGDFYHVDVVGARRAGLFPVLLDPLDLHRERDCTRIRSLSELLPQPVGEPPHRD